MLSLKDIKEKLENATSWEPWMSKLEDDSRIGAMKLLKTWKKFFKERMNDEMNETKFAELDREQLQELNELEEKLGVTLIAYDTATTSSSSSTQQYN